MNIDEYRAMNAAEADNSNIATAKEVQVNTPVETPAVTPVAEVTTPVGTETPVTVPVVENLPTKYNIDGVGEFTADEIKEMKQGTLRQQDYTRKTQEVANARRENQQAIELFQYLKANPQIAKNMLATEGATPTDTNNLRAVNPDFTKVDELATQISDMKLQREIDDMKTKYADFEVLDVLETAMQKGFTSLEDAYTFNKGQRTVNPSTVVTTPVVAPVTTPAPTFDADAERNRIRAELVKEFENDRVSTSTIITSASATPVTPKADVVLTADEEKARIGFRMSVEDYIKYK